MFASKLTIDKRWLHQQSKQTDMLLWMQNHPNKLYDTTITNIVHTMILDKDFDLGLTEGSANQVFYALMRRGLVGKDREKKRANFYINYYHPDLPPVVKERQPKQEAETVEVQKEEPKIEEIIVEKKTKKTVSKPKTSPKAEIVIRYGKVEIVFSKKIELDYLVKLTKKLNGE